MLLATNIIIPLGLMLPAAGVEARLSSKEEAGAGLVRLVKAEWIPRESGVLVRAKLEGVLGEPGSVVIEPGALCGGESGLSAWIGRYVVTRNYLMCHGWDRGTRGRGRRRLARRSQRLGILSTSIPFAQDANRIHVGVNFMRRGVL